MRIIKCAVEMLIFEYKRVIAMILLLALVLLLIMSSIMIKISSNYAYEELNKVLYSEISNTAKIATDEDIFGNQSIIDKINQIDGVIFFGTMASYIVNDECLGEFRNLQDSFMKKSDGQDGTEILFMNSSLLKLCDLKLECGKSYDELDNSSNTQYLYLGYEYYGTLHYEVGDTFDDINGNHYEIAGVFRKNQRMVDESLLNEFSIDRISYSNNLDKMIVCVENRGAYSTGFWLGTDNKHDINNIVKKVRDTLLENGYVSRFITFQEMIDNSMEDGSILYSLISKITILVTIAAILMLISIFLVVFSSEIKRYGIMYSLGFYTEDIEKIILAKNIFIILTATIVSNTLFRIIVNKRYGTADNKWLIDYLVGYYIYPKIIICILIFIALISLGVRKLLYNQLPAEMINERY